MVEATKKVTPGTQAAGYSGGSCGGHFRVKFPVDQEGHCVYLSSSRGYDSTLAKGGDIQEIDVGVYLDSGWKYSLYPPQTEVVVSDLVPADLQPSPELLAAFTSNYRPHLPGIYFPWSDGQAIALNKLDALMEWINPLIDAGKRIEIACIGGHGRTGTLVSAIVLFRNPTWKAADVISAVRTIYCDHAVETYAQVKCVHEFANETPPKQEVKTWTPPKSTPSTVGSASTLTTKELTDIRVFLQKSSIHTLGLDWSERNDRIRKEVQALLPAGSGDGEGQQSAFTQYSLD